MKKWSKETKVYDLGEGFQLELADNAEYAPYYAVYRANDNIGFRNNFQQKLDVVGRDDISYWIKKDGFKIGGVWIQPNNISGLFVIPPFNDTYRVLKLLKKTLVFWSDENKDIEAFTNNLAQNDYFTRLGFRVTEMGRWMIRPTESYEISWDDRFQIVNLKKESREEIGKLFYEAFKDHPGDNYSIEKYLKDIDYYFEHYSHIEGLDQASSLIYDKETKLLIGACLVSEWNEWPLIYDIGVKKEYRGLGLASNMIKKALTLTKEKYPAMRLHVTIGNKAESVYYNLGFLPAEKTTSFILPRN